MPFQLTPDVAASKHGMPPVPSVSLIAPAGLSERRQPDRCSGTPSGSLGRFLKRHLIGRCTLQGGRTAGPAWRRPFTGQMRAGALTLMLGAAVLTSACQKSSPAFTNLDISGNQSFATDFALPDSGGKARTLADYRGRVVVMVFGYTHCPDVCPATLAELAQALQQLGADARRVQVVFVSVDPERDTPEVLGQYVRAFDPSFVALRPADRAQLDAVTKAFKIYYSQNAPEVGKAASSAPASGEAGAYTVDHTAASLVFDADGKLRLYARDAQGAGPWVHDLKLLLDEKK